MVGAVYSNLVTFVSQKNECLRRGVEIGPISDSHSLESVSQRHTRSSDISSEMESDYFLILVISEVGSLETDSWSCDSWRNEIWSCFLSRRHCL